MTNPNYNFGTLTKRNVADELETYIVSVLRRPSLYTGELTFTLLVVTRLLQFKTLYHEITGREAIQALIALRVIKISGGQYVPDTCFHASAKSGSGSNWSSYGGWDMFSEADLARLNEIYPVEE